MIDFDDCLYYVDLNRFYLYGCENLYTWIFNNIRERYRIMTSPLDFSKERVYFKDSEDLMMFKIRFGI